MDVIQGTIVAGDSSLTLKQVCRSSGANAEIIIEMVEIGLLEPRGRDPVEWRFPDRSLARVRSTLRLRDDLEVNFSGAALALELIDEIRHLRGRVRALEQELGEM
jgi:chaperone modulatory protein CbpM